MASSTQRPWSSFAQTSCTFTWTPGASEATMTLLGARPRSGTGAAVPPMVRSRGGAGARLDRTAGKDAGNDDPGFVEHIERHEDDHHVDRVRRGGNEGRQDQDDQHRVLAKGGQS